MKKNLKKIGLVAFAMLTFSMALLLSIGPVADGSSSFGITSAQAQTTPPAPKPCFTKTTTKCGSLGPYNGGERTTCDNTGSYVGGETCTPVACGTGTGDKLECKKVTAP
ncbi:hypothetical protein [Mucilaginibacter sp. 44-25]|uniref:hypothetical protein n=1 Tax=Mucilaginibacter sp. 44-25 TaxID=1895794 RepID=UPI000B03B679|nr:hypothetical protein [Mucilaginibacter sp. 44-25]